MNAYFLKSFRLVFFISTSLSVCSVHPLSQPRQVVVASSPIREQIFTLFIPLSDRLGSRRADRGLGAGRGRSGRGCEHSKKALLLLILHTCKLLLELYSWEKANLWNDRFCRELSLCLCPCTTQGHTETSKISKLNNSASGQNLWEFFHEILDDIRYISCWEWRQVCQLFCKLLLRYFVRIDRLSIKFLWLFLFERIRSFNKFVLHHCSWLLERKKSLMLVLCLMNCFFFQGKISQFSSLFFYFSEKVLIFLSFSDLASFFSISRKNWKPVRGISLLFWRAKRRRI